MIAASIVTYNTDSDELTTCLTCLSKCHQVLTIEIIDNSCSQETEKLIKDKFPQCNYIPCNNIGYGAANNISIRHSFEKTEELGLRYHLVLNSDVVFEPDVVTRLVERLESNTDIGLIMPSVTDINGSPQSCSHRLPTPYDLFMHRFAPHGFLKKWRRAYDILPQRIGYDLNVPFMHGCFMLFTLEALNRIGLFDERYFLYLEDVDITRRVHRHYRTIVCHDILIRHMHRADSRHNLRMMFIHAVNTLRYFSKWGYFFDSERRKINKEFNRQLPERLLK